MRVGQGLFSGPRRPVANVGTRFQMFQPKGFKSIRPDKKRKMPTEFQRSKVKEGADYTIQKDSANTLSGSILTSEGKFGLTEGYSPFKENIAKARKRRGEGKTDVSISG